MSQHSPCINVCRIDDASGYCLGCGRTRAEVALWRDASAAALEQVWAELPARRAKLGIGLHLLDWTPADLGSFISESLRCRGGTWVMGSYGAVAEFCIGKDEPVDLDLADMHAAAVTPRGAVRFRITDRIRALALTRGKDAARDLIVLAVPRGQFEQPAPTGLLALGPDREAVRASARDDALFDLGLGIGITRFCLRAADQTLAADLEKQAGQRCPELLSCMGRRILESSPARVVRSPLGRIEVFTPIPPPGGRSPDGPHTHLLPAHLALNRETPPGFELPATFVPCAIFYPATGPADSCT